MLSHYYTAIFLMAYGQKLLELQIQSRIKTATINRAALQSYSLGEERKGEKVDRRPYASRGQ